MFYSWWKNNEDLWFNNNTKKCDEMVISSFINSPILTEKTPINMCNRIIENDQVPRHYYRFCKLQFDRDVFLSKYSTISCDLAKEMIVRDWDLCIEIKMRGFILMPFRHLFTRNALRFVIHRTKVWENRDPCIKQNKYYIRFLRATVLSLNKLENKFIYQNDLNISSPVIHMSEIHRINDILDVDSPRMSLSMRFDNIHHRVDTNPVFVAFDNYFRNYKHSEITVSLSGGVDSMVALMCVKLWRDINQRKLFIRALHINYGNRDSTQTEVNMLRFFCSKIEIPLFVRHIWEIKRRHKSCGGNMYSREREMYESVTREIRFSFYQVFGVHVILGHNKDDCTENIFTNLSCGTHFENLRGMQVVSEERVITIIRPMLNVPKTQIIQFAIDHGVPFLENSTPRWTKRGKIRDGLVKNITSFDSNIIPALNLFADKHKEMCETIVKTIINPFIKNNIRDNKIILTDDCKKIWTCDMWKLVLYHICSTKHYSPPSLKSITNFVKMLKKNSYSSDGKQFIISKQLTLVLKESYLFLI